MLEWVFIFCFALGAIYAVFAGVFAGIFGGVLHTGHDLPGHDVDLSHDIHAGGVEHGGDLSGHSPEVHFSPVSPPVIAMFLISFGGSGLLGIKSFHWHEPAALIPFALACGLGIGAVTFFLFFWVMKHSQVSSASTDADALGTIAEVIVPLPAHGTGEVAYNARGRRFNGPARSTDGRPIPQGKRVVVEKVDGSIYIVREESQK